MTQETRPLDGLRVLDLSRAVSGPIAGRILADLGADVVRPEPCPALRDAPPHAMKPPALPLESHQPLAAQ